MKTVTEKTFISLSLAITLFGGIGWLTTMWNKTHAVAEELKELKSTTRDELVRINQKLDRLIERSK